MSYQGVRVFRVHTSTDPHRTDHLVFMEREKNIGSVHFLSLEQQRAERFDDEQMRITHGIACQVRNEPPDFVI